MNSNDKFGNDLEKPSTGAGQFIEGFALAGEYVKNLPDKHFKIIGKPRYEDLPDLDTPTMVYRKLVLDIELADGTQLKYYPNKTSQKAIIEKVGYKLENWVGYNGEFYTAEQKVGAALKQVIYVK